MLELMHTVTTLHFKEQQFGTSPRTVAWYPNLEDALQCVMENQGDIYETTYTHAVIETLAPGLYPRVIIEHWFVWQGDFASGGYRPCAKPESLAGVSSFAIG
jgi:hypothetical protein